MANNNKRALAAADSERRVVPGNCKLQAESGGNGGGKSTSSSRTELCFIN
jgi:hypothetical protein